MFDRLGMLPQALQGRAQIAERFGIVRPDRQGRAATTDSALEIAERPICLGQVGMVNVGVRPQSHGPADQLDRAGWALADERARRADDALRRSRALVI